jgi:exopolysaccharide biosynthesis protein
MQITPDADLFQAIGGGPQVVKDGALYYDPHPALPGKRFTLNPQTAIGISRDGTHALIAVFDGRGKGLWKSRGMTQAGVAYFMLAHGAYQAMLFDSGGSSEMVARLPGQHSLSVINWPSSGYERPLGNGLFFYLTSGTHVAAIIRHCQLSRSCKATYKSGQEA